MACNGSAAASFPNLGVVAVRAVSSTVAGTPVVVDGILVVAMSGTLVVVAVEHSAVSAWPVAVVAAVLVAAAVVLVVAAAVVVLRMGML